MLVAKAFKHLGMPMALLLVAGCSAQTGGTGADEFEPVDKSQATESELYLINCSEIMKPEDRVALDAIDAMIEDREFYAGLARLESVSFDTQAHWLRWAQLLGQVGQLDTSESAFRAIVDTCDSYQAYHGLGVVLVKKGQLDAAVEALDHAKELAPADISVRNDLGYALLRAGRYGRAAFELRTAFELSKGRPSIGQNMIAAYYLNGGMPGLGVLRRELSINDEQLQSGIRLAEKLKGGMQ